MIHWKHNWAESLTKQFTCEDILEKVRRTEKECLVSVWVNYAITLSSIMLIVFVPGNNLKLFFVFLFMGILGLVNTAVTKLWGQMIFNSLYLLYESRIRTEAEIRKSEAADL